MKVRFQITFFFFENKPKQPPVSLRVHVLADSHGVGLREELSRRGDVASSFVRSGAPLSVVAKNMEGPTSGPEKKLDRIVLLGGANDLSLGPVAFRASLGKVREQLSQHLDRLLVVGVPNCTDNYNIFKLNLMLKNWCSDNSVEFLDISGAPGRVFGRDLFHFNRRGKSRLAEFIFNKLHDTNSFL